MSLPSQPGATGDPTGSEYVAVRLMNTCPVCGTLVPDVPRPGPAVPAGEWTTAKSQALGVFDHWDGSRQGWPTASAQTLLALLLFVSAHDRGQSVSEVPWSAARVRTLAREESLRFYLVDTLARITADAARHAAAALRDLHFHHQYDGWESSDGLSSDPGPDPRDYFSHGLEVLVPMLDATLLAERGGWAPQSTVQVLTPVSRGVPEDATVVAPLWEHQQPSDADPGLVDLLPGPPTGYQVRLASFHAVLDVRTTDVIGEPPPPSRQSEPE